MLTPGRHPKNPRMEQKVDYYTCTLQANCWYTDNIHAWYLYLLDIQIILSQNKSDNYPLCSWKRPETICGGVFLFVFVCFLSWFFLFFLFLQTEWRPFFFFLSSSHFNYNSLSQRLMQINFKICYKQQIAVNNELVTNPLLKVWHTQTGYPAENLLTILFLL